MNRFTLILHNKGWTVKEVINYWGIDYSTYNRRCNNPKMFNQLDSMCKGMPLNLTEKQRIEFKATTDTYSKQANELKAQMGELNNHIKRFFNNEKT